MESEAQCHAPRHGETRYYSQTLQLAARRWDGLRNVPSNKVTNCTDDTFTAKWLLLSENRAQNRNFFMFAASYAGFATYRHNDST